MTEIRCENCDFFDVIDDKCGLCRRYPPYVQGQMAQRANRVIGQRPSPVTFVPVVMWCQVKPDEWCGEFRSE